MGYYSTVKNEIESFVVTWVDLESIVQSEVSQRKIPYINTYVWNREKWR